MGPRIRYAMGVMLAALGGFWAASDPALPASLRQRAAMARASASGRGDSAGIEMRPLIVAIVIFLVMTLFFRIFYTSISDAKNVTGNASNDTSIRSLLDILPILYVIAMFGLPIGIIVLSYKSGGKSDGF